MPLALVRTADEELVCPEVERLLRAALSARGRATLLVPSFSQALDAQRALAAAGGLSLGVTVSAPSAWAAERWEVWGDGRRLVDDASRAVLAARVVSRASARAGSGRPGAAVADNPGTAELLGELARRGLVWLAGAPAPEGVSAAERALVGLLADYARELEAAGLVEACAAEAALPELLDAAGGEVAPVVCAGLATLPRSQRELLAGLAVRHEVTVVAHAGTGPADAPAEALLSQLAALAAGRGAEVGECSVAPGPAPERAAELEGLARALFRGGRVAPTGAVRLLLPAGPSARPELAARTLASLAGEGCSELVVAAPDAARAWRELGPRLAARSLACRAQLTVPLASLECGRALLEYLRSVARLAELDETWPAPEPVPGAPRRGTVRVRLADMSWWPPRELSDFVLSDVSHVGAERARALDARWRSNRLLTPGALLAQLTSEREVSPEVAAATRELLRGRIGSAASRLLGPLAQGEGDAPASPEAAAVLGAVLDVARSLKELGLTADPSVPGRVGLSELVATADAVLSATRVPLRLSREVEGARARVLVTTPAAAARLGAASADALVLLGQSAEESPVPSADDVASALLCAYRVEPEARPTDELRARFLSLVRAPRRALALERPLFGADGRQCYPSVMLTELLSCYGVEGDAGADELARALGERSVLTRSETPVRENAASSGVAAARELTELPAAAGRIGAAERACVSPPPEGVSAEEDRPLLSASQIETYLECPYKWFSLRRLRLRDADAGFTGAETGTFAHRVLEVTRSEQLARAVERSLHETGLADERAARPDAMQDAAYRERVAELVSRAQADPAARVAGSSLADPEDLAEARSILEEEFDAHLSHQYQLVGGRRPLPQALVPHSAQEHGRLQALRRDLSTLLDYESTMLRGFEPRFFEWGFGRGGEEVSYAGVRLTGTVDRIDVDAHGQAVVIDYKHKSDASFAREYDAFSGDGCDLGAPFAPRRVQALIYAQVVRRAFPDLTVRAGVYLCTRGAHALAGAVDENLVEGVFGERMPAAARVGRLAVPRGATFGQEGARGMEALLDACEETIAAAVARLLDGDIEAAPVDAEACRFCPVLNCERRLRA